MEGKGPATTYKWADVSEHQYLFWLQFEQISFSDGNTFVFSAGMTGGRNFLEICDRKLVERE